MLLFLVFLLVFVATIFTPGSLIAVLFVNTLFGLLISTVQVLITLFPSHTPLFKKLNRHPHVSILVPAYNEPPALLLQTLEAVSQLQYDNFEVVVIDNNTKNEEIWKPVEKFCADLGNKFRFMHLDTLPGYKAGALNYALKRINPNSEYVAVIDADYVVRQNFIETALSYFTDSRIALVQFPQEYRNAIAANEPIADEYKHFFKIYMNMANQLECVPSTGTVSMYTTSGLSAIGGFRAEALTEDADAGLRIYEAGYKGIYVARPVGYGLMPYDIEAYRKQKHRWALGNAQSIRKLLSLFGKIPFTSWLGFFSHLTAWDHLNFLPFAVLAGYVFVVTPLVPSTELHRALLNIASFSIFITVLSKFMLLFATLRGQKRSLSRAFKALMVHMGLTYLYSEALFEFWFNPSATFERTNKFILSSMPSLLKNSYKELLLGLWFLAGAFGTVLYQGRLITLLAFLTSALALLSIYYVYFKISPTKYYSKKLLAQAELKYAKYLSLGAPVPHAL